MLFLGCDGLWILEGTQIGCDGNLQTFTAETLAEELQVPKPLTDEDADALFWATAGVFASVFVFLVLRKSI